MPSIEEVAQYDVNYSGGGTNATGYPYRAIIGLRRSDGSLIGAAYFHHDPASITGTDQQTANGYVWCHFPADSYPHVLDLLRNEGPVYLHYVAGMWNVATLTTSMEPVGENELQP